MAFDKNGTSGSAEELDAYGVWVKSEPQDMVSGLADTAGFGGGAMPFDSGFGTAFDDIGLPGMDMSDFDGDASPINIDDFQVSSFGDETSLDEDDGVRQEVSAQLLMKIADEISSIRDELTALKREFADIRAESGFAAGNEAASGGFFAEETGEDDEKIALTGDEMDNILTSADFSGDDDAAYDALREEEAAALRKLSEENEAAGQENTPESDEDAVEEEIIDIDFDELGIDLGDELAGRVVEAAPETVPQEDEPAGMDMEVTPETVPQEYDLQLAEGFLLDSLAEMDEMRDLKLDGAAPITSAPDDASYLEKYPFALENPVFEEPYPGETNININVNLGDVALRLDEASLDESGEGLGLDNDAFSLDAAALGLEDFAIENPVIGDELNGDNPFEAMDLSDAVIEDPVLTVDLSDPPLEEPDLGDISLEMSDMDDLVSDAALGAKEDSLAQVIPEGFELGAEEAAAPLDEDLVTLADDIGISVDDDGLSLGADLAMGKDGSAVSAGMKDDLKDMLSYMDGLLESLPEEKIEEFAKSEYFDTYKKIFKELGLV